MAKSLTLSTSALADPSEVAEAEVISASALVDEFAATVRSTIQSSLLSDPSDYTVASDNTIEDTLVLYSSAISDEKFAKQLPDLFHTVARGDTLSEIADCNAGLWRARSRRLMPNAFNTESAETYAGRSADA